jgi:hydrogenase nickel incorporation protein HypA/HybF
MFQWRIDAAKGLPTLRAMHELALIQSIVAAIEERVQPARVDVVRLEIGELAGVSAEALRFCFDVCARGTALEGAVLEIEGVAGRARCRKCGNEVGMASFLELCTCGSAELEVLAGQELRIRNVEVH